MNKTFPNSVTKILNQHRNTTAAAEHMLRTAIASLL